MSSEGVYLKEYVFRYVPKEQTSCLLSKYNDERLRIIFQTGFFGRFFRYVNTFDEHVVFLLDDLFSPLLRPTPPLINPLNGRKWVDSLCMFLLILIVNVRDFMTV